MSVSKRIVWLSVVEEPQEGDGIGVVTEHRRAQVEERCVACGRRASDLVDVHLSQAGGGSVAWWAGDRLRGGQINPGVASVRGIS